MPQTHENLPQSVPVGQGDRVGKLAHLFGQGGRWGSRAKPGQAGPRHYEAMAPATSCKAIAPAALP